MKPEDRSRQVGREEDPEKIRERVIVVRDQAIGCRKRMKPVFVNLGSCQFANVQRASEPSGCPWR